MFAIAVFLAASTAAAQMPDTRWYTEAIAANPDTANFIIFTADQLAGLAAIANGTAEGVERYDFYRKTITLAADINLSVYDNWVPIGNVCFEARPLYKTSSTPPEIWPGQFSGIFDGGGHVISNLAIDRPDADCQGLFGRIGSGEVKNLGLEDIDIRAGNYVGGIAGLVNYIGITNCYSTGTVSGNARIGGIAGYLMGGTVSDCYSAAAVSGHDVVGGVAGLAADADVRNCVALNPYVAGTDVRVGRVVGSAGGMHPPGYYPLVGNAAYAGMKNSDGDTAWINKGVHSFDGEDITAAEINADGTVGGRFTAEKGWTIEDGLSIDLNGETVVMPRLIKGSTVSVASTDRVIPQDNGSVDDIAVVAPVNTLITKFFAGPNPISKSSGPVYFYHQGKSIKSGTLTDYDATGNVINKIHISENPNGRDVARNALTMAESAEPRRVVGTWDLKDRKGRLVAEGTYLVRGTIVTLDGSRERVSVVVGVR